MASQVVLPHGTYPAGTRELGPANVPQGLTEFTLGLARGEWVAGVSLSVVVDLSLDDGATWNSPHPAVDPYPVGFTAPGGVVLTKTGGVSSTTSISAPLPQPENSARKIRATITITGGSLTTTGTLTLL